MKKEGFILLIITDRHTKEDLEIWKEYEEMDGEYYKTHNMKQKEEKAIDIIKKFCTEKNYYLSVSWGKDSTVMLHLAYQAKKTNCIVSFTRIEKTFIGKAVHDFNNDLVRDSFLKEYKNIMYIEVSSPGIGKMNAMRRFEKITGLSRCVLGIRAKESGIRKKSAQYHGFATENKCRPLLGWSAQDIFAYLYHYNLPIHPLYGMTDGGIWDRCYLRVDGAIGGEGGIVHGRDIWEKKYYQDILNKIEKEKI